MLVVLLVVFRFALLLLSSLKALLDVCRRWGFAVVVVVRVGTGA